MRPTERMGQRSAPTFDALATPVDAGFEGHTAAGGLRLLRALHGGHEGALALSPGWQLPMRAARARAATGAAE